MHACTLDVPAVPGPKTPAPKRAVVALYPETTKPLCCTLGGHASLSRTLSLQALLVALESVLVEVGTRAAGTDDQQARVWLSKTLKNSGILDSGLKGSGRRMSCSGRLSLTALSRGAGISCFSVLGSANFLLKGYGCLVCVLDVETYCYSGSRRSSRTEMIPAGALG